MLLVFAITAVVGGSGFLAAYGAGVVVGNAQFEQKPALMSMPEKTMIFWVGLRGAVPIILATFPLLEGVPVAKTIFNITFFIVLASILIQGTTLPMVARWLGVQETTPDASGGV